MRRKSRCSRHVHEHWFCAKFKLPISLTLDHQHFPPVLKVHGSYWIGSGVRLNVGQTNDTPSTSNHSYHWEYLNVFAPNTWLKCRDLSYARTLTDFSAWFILVLESLTVAALYTGDVRIYHRCANIQCLSKVSRPCQKLLGHRGFQFQAPFSSKTEMFCAGNLAKAASILLS